MTTKLTGRSGKIDNVFSIAELEYIIKYLSNIDYYEVPGDGNRFYGVGTAHPLFSWLNKKVFDKIKSLHNVDMKMAFGSYLDEKTPWEPHSDYYHKLIGEPHRAFLIPISTDYHMDDSDKANTVVFNEECLHVDQSGSKNRRWVPDLWHSTMTKKENNALVYKDTCLSHVPHNELECLTVQNILNWTLGSVLYWDERLMHSSDNFLINNVKSKQAIVIHTYVV